MNKNQIMSIALGSAFGTSIGTTIGAIADNVAMGIVYGSLIGLLIGAVLALVIFKDSNKEEKWRNIKSWCQNLAWEIEHRNMKIY